MYQEDLATRVRSVLETHPMASERKMFGGLCFMIGGNMACGVVGNDLMVRTGPNGYDDALSRPGARPMDFTGRPMAGMVFVAADSLDDEDIASWVGMGIAFASSLPAKTG